MAIRSDRITDLLDVLTDNQLEDLYIDWVNNYLTVDKFAEHYGLTYFMASDIIDKGRKINES